jgi:hypothetical protein
VGISTDVLSSVTDDSSVFRAQMANMSVHCDKLSLRETILNMFLLFLSLSYLLFVPLLFIVYLGILSVCSVLGRQVWIWSIGGMLSLLVFLSSSLLLLYFIFLNNYFIFYWIWILAACLLWAISVSKQFDKRTDWIIFVVWEICLLFKTSRPALGLPNLVLNGWWGLPSQGQWCWGARRLTTHLHLVPRFRMSGAVPPFPLYACMTLLPFILLRHCDA